MEKDAMLWPGEEVQNLGNAQPVNISVKTRGATASQVRYANARGVGSKYVYPNVRRKEVFLCTVPAHLYASELWLSRVI